MLILTFRNLSNLAPVSDYWWEVLENNKRIDCGRLNGHKREDGWRALVWKFARSLESEGENKEETP